MNIYKSLQVPPFGRLAEPDAADHFGMTLASQKEGKYRVVNTYPGQGFSVGFAVVHDAKRAGLPENAVGTCWWQGLSSTYFAYNPNTDIGCIVFAGSIACTAKQPLLGEVISWCHKELPQTPKSKL